MKLSIIVPLYNEEKHITEVLSKLTNVRFPEFITAHEIIIVDDCSQDRSRETVSRFISGISHIKLLHHDVNRGKGAAVRTGLQAANGDLFIIQDADLELTPCDIPVMLRTLKDRNAAFVNGSRYLKGIERPPSSKSRIFFNKLFTWITAILTRSTITDMACGYKLFTRDLYEKLTLRENRFAFETELIIKALRVQPQGLVEAPVHYFPRSSRQGKKLKAVDGLIIFWAIVKYGLLKAD